MIKVLHKRIPGRVRFSVQGLYRSEAVKARLEEALSRRPEVLRVSASTLTGNLLIHFQSNKDIETVEAWVLEDLPKASGDAGSVPKRAVSGRGSKETAAHPVPAHEGPSPPWAEWLRTNVRKISGILNGRKEIPWHLMGRDDVLDVYTTPGQGGLLEVAAEDRLRLYGSNTIPQSGQRSRWDILAEQFCSLPVALLGAAAGLSLLTGGILDAVVIMGVVVANAAVGYATESEAERTIHSLRTFLHPTAEVLRGGQSREIPADDLVVGDLVHLKPGTYVPADSRLIQGTRLTVDESALTGESMPVYKASRRLRRHGVPLAERTNMVYRGTLVLGGEGLALVVATGRYTEMGRLQLLLEETSAPETPIERKLRQTGDHLVILGCGICGVVFMMGFLRGYGMVAMLRMAISLAAAAVPEGLPAAATINFSLGIKNMKRHKVLIRQLQAVETLGSVQTVCLDKTGTITQNRLSVSALYSGSMDIEVRAGGFRLGGRPLDPVGYEELNRLISVCVLCNETRIEGEGVPGSYVLSGSPTENALILMAERVGIDVKDVRRQHPLLKVHHRAESRLFMSTLHDSRNGDGRLYAVKGSPPEVLAMCDRQALNGEVVPLSTKDRIQIERENSRMAGRGLRVLGVAFAQGPEVEDELKSGLSWLGLVGMEDPIREGVRTLIQKYHHAGMDTVMITGDQSATAYAVAEDLHLSRGEHIEILDSTALKALDPELLRALAGKVTVYSRVSPSHKLQIVQALQAAGRVVAMTGDGINDGPALKAADIGIAMGLSGTDVAREVADVVLEDDKLETLIMAVREGRTTYNNIRKSVHFFLSTTMSEIMVMFAAVAAGIGFPLNVMQLLWINIISDIFPGIALSLEAPEPDILDEPPRDPKAPLFSSGDYRRMALESAVISASSMGAYTYGLVRYGAGAQASSLAFQSLTLAQLLHVIRCRSDRHSVFDENRPPPNPTLNVALGGSLALQALTAVLPGLRRFLGLTPFGLLDAAVAGGSALLPLVINEATKKRRGERA